MKDKSLLYELRAYLIYSNFRGSNTDGSFTTAVSNLCLSS